MSFLYRIQKITRQNRIVASLILLAMVLLLAKPTPRSFLIGLPIIIVGEFFRTLSSGYIEKDSSLSMGGTYSITRNPLYLGNFLMGLGFMIIANQPVLLILFLVLFALIYYATIVDEERGLLQRYGSEFLLYMSSVPRFFPKPWKWNSHQRSFDWSLVMKHREYNTWLGILGGIFLFITKMVLLK